MIIRSVFPGVDRAAILYWVHWVFKSGRCEVLQPLLQLSLVQVIRKRLFKGGEKATTRLRRLRVVL
ncbi:hypothetical protein I7I50_00393 [Histoplasma capsulatum G186AR]|uniref:Uncharacterized protein n=1 Tax=Ajellomyces capsulatus TaxID=5037 RepID=A0A8H8CVS2_AJECA|nr:hypothetical protein I7I52_07661 [Histoplasma capsulatum]QSS72526.1 hypothetical protein I7I50_00393 [Histoplasma capsulatum G186AR]